MLSFLDPTLMDWVYNVRIAYTRSRLPRLHTMTRA